MKTMLKSISELFKIVFKEIGYILISFIISSVFFALIILIIYGLIKL